MQRLAQLLSHHQCASPFLSAAAPLQPPSPFIHSGPLPACLPRAAVMSQQQARSISEENLGAGGQEQIVDMFERQSRSASRRKEHGVPHLLTTTHRESLALYREVLRYSNLFVWRDQEGRPWRDLIRESARKEFEAARFEPDPEIVNKLIITGRDAMHRTVETFLQKRQQIIEEEEAAHNLRQ